MVEIVNAEGHSLCGLIFVGVGNILGYAELDAVRLWLTVVNPDSNQKFMTQAGFKYSARPNGNTCHLLETSNSMLDSLPMDVQHKFIRP